MDGIKIAVTGNIARVTEKPKYITSGTVGLPVEFTFDGHWDGLDKTAVFRVGHVSKIVSGLGESTTVPWEVLQNAHEWLSIGVYGTNEDGSVAIPTIWANVKVIDVGTSPDGDSCKAPSKAEWTRMLIGQSAYELAVALGFSGSEEKWIESLNGNPVELRCVDDMIQWRLQTEPEQEWQDLTNVAEFQQMAAEAAERAEKAAGDAEESAYNKQNKLAWVTDEDINAMFEGTYEGEEDEDPEGDGYLTVKKGSGLNSVEQVIDTDKEAKIPHAYAEGAVVYGEYGIVYDSVGENCEGSDTVSFSEDGTKIFFVNSQGEKKEFNVGETSFLVNYWNKIFGARCFAANNNNKLIGVHLAAFGNGNYLGYLYDPDNGWIEYPTIIPSAAAVFGTNNYVLADNAVSFGRDGRNFGINAVTGGDSSKAGGQNILKIDSLFGEYSRISQKNIGVVGGETYALRYDYKLSLTELNSNSVVARLIFKDKNGKELPQIDIPAEKVKTKDWTGVYGEITAPADAVSVSLDFWMWIDNAGECWINNISLRNIRTSQELLKDSYFEEGFDKWNLGYYTEAFSLERNIDAGKNSLTWGDHLKTVRKASGALGSYNDPNPEALFMIGNGTDENNRRNAFEVGEDYITIAGRKLTVEKLEALLALVE